MCPLCCDCLLQVAESRRRVSFVITLATCHWADSDSDHFDHLSLSRQWSLWSHVTEWTVITVHSSRVYLNIHQCVVKHSSVFDWTFISVWLNIHQCLVEHSSVCGWTFTSVWLNIHQCVVEHSPVFGWTFTSVWLNIHQYLVEHSSSSRNVYFPCLHGSAHHLIHTRVVSLYVISLWSNSVWLKSVHRKVKTFGDKQIWIFHDNCCVCIVLCAFVVPARVCVYDVRKGFGIL